MHSQAQPSTSSAQPFGHLELSEILKATKNFDESLVIGRGYFGDVYKGEVFNGAYVVLAAIKRLDYYARLDVERVWAEVERLSSLRHRNLVSLIGYCKYVKEVKRFTMWPSCNPVSRYDEETILAYEFIPNGTLKDHLHRFHTPLSWLQRLNICIDVARGLHYLHTCTRIKNGVVHGDIRSSNVLLTESWVAKISDFGLTKIGPSNQFIMISNGIYGYGDPCSVMCGQMAKMSDVYSFGVVLLEILCRKPALFKSLDNQCEALVLWVQDSLKERNLEDIIDPDMRNEIAPRCLQEFFRVIESCVYQDPKKRPHIAEIFGSLESIVSLQERFNNSLHSMLHFPSNKESSGDSSLLNPSVKEFTFTGLENATRGFSPELLVGNKKNLKVVLGWIDQNTLAPSKEGVGIAIAVKWITSETPLSYNEWVAEVNFLGKLAHPNIIKLVGCCRKDGHEHMLVYEHMAKSLSRFIYGDKSMKPLSWRKRLDILIGVARGLIYLYTTKGILSYFQSSDILLDEDFNAKIGSFGWVEVEERRDRIKLNGAFGYQKEKTDYDTIFGLKHDVFSFGLVLLETITGRQLCEYGDVFVGLEKLRRLAPNSKSDRRKANKMIKKLMDPRLEGCYSREGAFKCMTLARRCLAMHLWFRPSREEILLNLEKIYALV